MWQVVLAAIIALIVVFVGESNIPSGMGGEGLAQTVSDALGKKLDAECATVLNAWMHQADELRKEGKSPKPESEKVRACLGGHYAGIQPRSQSRVTAAGPSLTASYVDPRMYITWNVFKCEGENREGTAKEFANAVIGRKIDYLILDLRQNRGGCMAAALSILGLFAPRAGIPTVSETDAEGRERVRYWTKQTYLDRELGGAYIVIMTSRETCSASEVLAGGLRMLIPERVELVGDKTCGKHVYQLVRQYGDYEISVHGGEWFLGHGEGRRSVKGGISPTWPTKNVWRVTEALFDLRMSLTREVHTANTVVPKRVRTVPDRTCGPKASRGCP